MASNKRELKAYARFDGSGRIVPGSTILRKKMPKVGKWKEVQTYLCCNFVPIPFISVWRTTTPDESITLPYLIDGEYRGIIDWGDGTTSPNSYANRTHTYATAGDYTITITGAVIGFSFWSEGTPTYIRSVTQWGDLKLGNSSGYFAGCLNLDLSGVIDVLNLNGTTSLNNMFLNCTSLTTINRVNEWDISGVVNLSYMFEGASLFNQDLNDWNVSNVVSTSHMFNFATSFNGNISNWNVSSVTDMSNMFTNTAFNQNISGWNVSNVIDMPNMFQLARTFNQPLNSWNVSSVNNMSNMFQGANTFNQSLILSRYFLRTF